MSALLSSVDLAMAESRVAVHPIPPITDPMGKYWKQPNRLEIEIDDTHALMSRDLFEKLSEYSCTTPTGVYPGKMWKRYVSENSRDPQRIENTWWLCWFGDSPDPGFCSNHYRKILIV